MQHLQLLWVARSILHPESGVKSHAHPYYHLFYIHAGEFCFTVSGETYRLSGGQTLLVPPQIEHGYINETGIAGEYLEVKFAHASAGGETPVQICDDPLAGMLCSRILQEYSDLGKLADDAAAAYLQALLTTLQKNDRYQEKPQQFLYLDASRFSPLSRRIVHYLEAHCNEELSLDALGKAMDYNKTYLCAAFKKDTGLTILDCQNMIRIRRAAELIVYSDHSLVQVSQLCGFSSVSHFNRVFLKYAGITPGQARRAYPADILFGSHRSADKPNTQADQFMYSVLAQKRITPEMTRSLEEK